MVGMKKKKVVKKAAKKAAAPAPAADKQAAQASPSSSPKKQPAAAAAGASSEAGGETIGEQRVEVIAEVDSPTAAPEEGGEGEKDSCMVGEKGDPYLLKEAAYIKTDTNWKNKQRTLIFASRGISGQHRHLMEDLKKMMPHHKAEQKFEKNQDFKTLNEVAELRSCNNVIFFEARRHEFLYMHVSRVPFGPSFKFQVLNIHTSSEVKLSGNCLMNSRPLLTFDKPFETEPHLKLLKEMFTQAFGTPRNHPKSKPFHDHVMSFFYHDGKIWFRHYQVAPLTEEDANDPERQILTEIGPRFVLDPIHVLDGSFTGQKLYGNENYASPVAKKRELKKTQQAQMLKGMKDKERKKQIKADMRMEEDPTDDIFF